MARHRKHLAGPVLCSALIQYLHMEMLHHECECSWYCVSELFFHLKMEEVSPRMHPITYSSHYFSSSIGNTCLFWCDFQNKESIWCTTAEHTGDRLEFAFQGSQ